MQRLDRQKKILEIIKERDIGTQQELCEALEETGYEAKQATISRDIRELGLIKKVTKNNRYKYYHAGIYLADNESKIIGTLRNMIVSLKLIRNTVILRSHKDMAQSLCSIIDSIHMDFIEGTVYGIDTVMIICAGEYEAVQVYDKLTRFMA